MDLKDYRKHILDPTLPKTWIVWVHETWNTLLQFFKDGFAYIQLIYLYIYKTLEIKIDKKVTYQKKKFDKKVQGPYKKRRILMSH